MVSDNIPFERGMITALFTSVLVLSVSLFPIFQNFKSSPQDDFPLSYYPMFTKKRKQDTKVIHPIGVTRAGAKINLHYQVVADGGMNQVRRQINKQVRNQQAQQLCNHVAQMIDLHSPELHEPLVGVQIVSDRYNLAAYFAGERSPMKRNIEATAPVPSMTEFPNQDLSTEAVQQ